MNVRTKRVIVRVSIAIGILCLVLQAATVRLTHHSLGAVILGMAAPATAVVCGLAYLWPPRGRR